MRYAIAHHQVGLWSPLWNAGDDRLAEQTIAIYFLPFLLLPSWLAYAVVMFTQRFLAGYFTFRFAREQIRAGVWPALFVGMSYAAFFQSTLVSADNVLPQGLALGDGFAVAGIPALLWFFGRQSKLPGARYIFYAAFMGAAFGLSSAYAVAMFCLLAFAWFIWIEPRRDRRFWTGVGAFVTTYFVVSLPSAIPAWLEAPFSQRAAWPLNARLELVRRAAESLALIADNAVTFGLLLLGLIFIKPRSRTLVRLSAAAVLSCGAELLWYALKLLLGKDLGFLSAFQFDRINLLLPLTVTLGAACALALFESSDWRLTVSGQGQHREYSVTNILVTVALAALIAQSGIANFRMLQAAVGGKSYRALYEQPDLLQLRAITANQEPFRVATVEADAGFAWGYGFETADGYWSMTSHQYHEFWGAVIAPLLAADYERRRYFEDYGLRLGLFSPTNGFAQDSPVEFRRYYNLDLLSLDNVRYIVSPRPLNDPRLTLLASGSRDAAIQWARMQRYRKYVPYVMGNYPGEVRYVYENRDVMPRFFFVQTAKIAPNAADVLDAMRNASAHQLRTVAYFAASEVKPGIGDAFDIGSLRVVNYRADRIELETQIAGTRPALLLISNAYSKYWRAEIDGAPADILRADSTFQALSLPLSAHRVVLSYQPPYAIWR
jgi:hypothetical protein